MNSCPKREDTRQPHFFKVILDDAIRDGKLYIPRKFVRKYGDNLSSCTFLKVPNGAKWKVEVVKCDCEIWFHKGWQEFLKYYSLACGSFLVFEYNQTSCDFNVIIFDQTATEIDYPITIINNLQKEFQKQKVEETESDVSVEILSHLSPSRTTKMKSSLPFHQPNKKIKLDNTTGQVEAKTDIWKQKLDEAVLRISPLTAEEKKIALDRATANFKSKNPFFMIAMQPSYVHDGKVSIPTSFMKIYFKNQKGNAILSTIDGKIWSVEYSYNLSIGKVSAKMHRGWKKFAKDNHLEIGDVCVFELINRTNTAFKVVVFRNVKDANRNPSLGTHKKMKHEESSSISNGQSSKRLSCSKISRAVEAANKFTSANPFFKVIMSSCRTTVNVPMEFVKKCTKNSTEFVVLQVGNKKWPVKLIRHPSYKRGWLSAGWCLFRTENSLENEDVCVFELINTEFLLLKVTIFRNVK